MTANAIIILTTLSLIALDIITGCTKALKNKTFNSSEMREGLIRKSGTIFLLFMAYGLQAVCTYIPDLPNEIGIVFDGVALHICVMEIASNIENILAINPELGGEKIRGLFGITKDHDHEHQEEFNER